MAQIMIWLPSRESDTINVGHAALLADRAKEPAYVSWWPKGGVSLVQPGTSGHINNTFGSDVSLESNTQPLIVDLPCLKDQEIADWWGRVKDDGFAVPYSLEVLPKSDNYDLFSNNCSTIVFRAMIIGGAAEIVNFPKFDTITPPHILLWAKSIAAVIGAKNWFSVVRRSVVGK